jgi:hypothetical protein
VQVRNKFFVCKIRFLRIGTTLAIAMGMFWNVAAQTLTLNLQNCPKTTTSDGYWADTYNASIASLTCGDFVFSHSSMGGSPTTGGYWDGSIYSINGDNANYGYADTTGHAGSVDWLTHQWGVMAGGGLTTPPTVVKGAPYLVAYWGYYSDGGFDFNAKTVKVSLADNSTFTPQEIYICNHPWPYYGNIYGDGFARPFHSGDHFDLIVHGVKAGGTEVTKTIPLATYGRFLYQSPDWNLFDLTELGNNVQYLYFTMTSTDELIIGGTNYGPNTAVYFCMDKLKVTKTGGVVSTSVISQKSEATALKSVEITDYFPVASYAGGEVIVYDVKGKKVLKTTVKAGEKINLSELSAGDYHLKHGHRFIPIKKGGKK